MLVTDNGTVFRSAEFNQFTNYNGIRHIKTAPYHPSSNGLAERAVQTFKMGIKKQTSGTIKTKISRFLFQYRITPHTTTGVSPAELLLSRRPRTQLDQALPSVETRVIRQQERQATYQNQHSYHRVFHEQDTAILLLGHHGCLVLSQSQRDRDPSKSSWPMVEFKDIMLTTSGHKSQQ